MNNIESFFLNCKLHCWCAYNVNDEIVKHLKAESIVEAMKLTPHAHGTNRVKCTGCLIEDEQSVWIM